MKEVTNRSAPFSAHVSYRLSRVDGQNCGGAARRWGLSADRLEQPGEALLDFNLPTDLHAWLQSHGEPIS